jgi:serine/threonine-protein kinase
MAILRPGDRLGPYVIEGWLGQGGMAEVYQGRHETLNRPVAIKVLNPAFRADPTFPLRFRREARTVARLRHPNIVALYDYGEQGGISYLVMELATGGTLDEQVRRLSTLADVVEKLVPVGEALQFAHDRGVIHRDVKPINVLIDEQGRPLLADFGLARVADETLDVDLADDVIEGTAHYMPPEEVTGGDVDRRADIYAFGITTYQALTGTLPFDGPTIEAVLRQQVNAPPPSLVEALPGAPPSLDEAVRRATAKRPAERFDQVRAFVGELQQAATEAPSLPVRSGRTVMIRTVPATPNGRVESPGEAPAPAAAFCGNCGLALTAVDRFCRGCGTMVPDRFPRRFEQSSATVVPGEGPFRLPWLPDLADLSPSESPATPDSSSEPPALSPSPAALPALPPHRRPRGRRVTAFNRYHWLAFIVAFAVVMVVNTVGYWIAQSGRGAAQNVVFENLNLYIWDHLGIFKSVLATVALALALAAGVTMRFAVIDRRSLPARVYRSLRQNHRFVGYTAFVTAFAIGFLTCLGIYGFDTSSVRSTLHSTFGSALLIALAYKVVVVRWLPGQRRYLALTGSLVLVLFILVFLTSAVPYVWEQFTNDFPPYRPFAPGR